MSTTSVILICLIVLVVLSMAAKAFKNKNKSSRQCVTSRQLKELIKFLETADDAYILAYQTRQIQFFTKYATDHVCEEIVDELYREPPRSFGTSTLRERRWSVIEDTVGVITIKKEIIYKHIEVKKGIKVAIGDDLMEYWRVLIANGNFVVADICNG